MTANQLNLRRFNIKKLIFYLLIFSIVILPTSTIFGFNPKAVLLLLSSLIVITSLKIIKISNYSKLILFIIMVFYNLEIINYLISGEADYLFAFKHLLAISVTILVAIILIISFKKNIIKFEGVINILIVSLMVFSCIKIILNLLFVNSLINFFEFKVFHLKIFEVDIESQDIPFGMKRFTYPIDLLYPLITYIVFIRKNINLDINKYICLFFIITSGASIFFSYSRYLFIYYTVVIYLCFPKQKKLLILLGILFIIVSIIATNGVLNEFFVNRFLSVDVAAGDNLREEQFEVLIEQFWQAPIFGKGLGYGPIAMIRDVNSPFSYELQWVSMLMQFGLIGFAILILIYTIPILAIYKKNKFSNSILLIYSMILFSGFTNPYLMSSQFALIFFAIFISLLQINRNLK